MTAAATADTADTTDARAETATVPGTPATPVPGTDRVSFTVRVPATAANLGPGFDALGLALDLRDCHRFVPTAPGSPPVTVTVTGEGAGIVADDDANLVVLAARAAAADAGTELPPFALTCENRVPHGLGLGSSAAAIVAGVVGGRSLLGLARDPAVELRLSARLEGHPDNVAPAILGGFTVAWCETAPGAGRGPLPGGGAGGGAGAPPVARAVSLAVSGFEVVAFLPPAPMSTSAARGLLPPTVTHADAAHAAGRAALVVAAVTGRPDLLFAATEDRLHTRARGVAMPVSLALLDRLRAVGVAAVLSGAGPTVLALVPTGRRPAELDAATTSLPTGWRRVALVPDPVGTTVT